MAVGLQAPRVPLGSCDREGGSGSSVKPGGPSRLRRDGARLKRGPEAPRSCAARPDAPGRRSSALSRRPAASLSPWRLAALGGTWRPVAGSAPAPRRRRAGLGHVTGAPVAVVVAAVGRPAPSPSVAFGRLRLHLQDLACVHQLSPSEPSRTN